MNIDDFRRHAHEMVDWMADYLETVEDYPVRAQVAPGEIAAKLSDTPPEQGEAMAAIFADFKRDVLPGITHWQHPGFLAYFPANASPPSVLAEMLTATLGAQCMLWETSPAATEMETKVLDWLRQMLGIGTGWTGVIQDSASTAALCAILTARERALDWRGNAAGLAGQGGLTLYCSTETHSSIEKAAKIAGIGAAHCRKIAVDATGAMRVDALAAQIESDIAEGLKPIAVVATLGTTGTGGVDPLRPVGEICRAHDLHLHVDAAWAGSALILPETRWMIEGIEAVDSFVFNPHKWLLTNFDCSAHFVRDPDSLVRTLTILPEYLRSRHQGEVIDYRDWSVPLGRRFRALKLWFVIRSYGVEGLREMVRRHIALAEDFAGWIEAAADFELVRPAQLALFCFRYRPAGVPVGDLDALNRRLLAALNDDGRIYLTQTVFAGDYVIRVSVGQTTTTAAHLSAAWDVMRDTAHRQQF